MGMIAGPLIRDVDLGAMLLTYTLFHQFHKSAHTVYNRRKYDNTGICSVHGRGLYVHTQHHIRIVD